MSQPWWGRETSHFTHIPNPQEPVLVENTTRDEIRSEIESRILSYTPEWNNLREGDAGFALLKLYAELSEPVISRLNKLPEKAFIEFLRAADVTSFAAKPARTLLEFSASDSAPTSVYIAEGFQVSAPAVDGTGDVIFETENDLSVVPGSIESTFVQEGNEFYEIDLSGSDITKGVLAFGNKPKAGSALLLGMNTNIVPSSSLTIGMQLSREDGAPPAMVQGGIESMVTEIKAGLRWELLDGGSFVNVEVINDETRGITQSGIVELRMPRKWQTGTPAGITTDQELRWLRIRISHGGFTKPPRLAFVRLNMVSALAAKTVRDEVLQYVPDSKGRLMSLSQAPVIPGSLRLVVNEGKITSFIESDSEQTDEGNILWQQVDNLELYGPDDRVYVLDEVNGEVQFGDGINGAALPRGFRHVVAQRYQVTSGRESAVGAEEISTLVSSAPFLTGVTNPLAASGGRDEEPLEKAVIRGPEKIRARGRAVTVADYALLALDAPGADISRAHAIAGKHAGLNGATVPGVVSIYLIGAEREDGPPYPDEGSLRAVGKYIAENVAPGGIELVTAAPRFHQVSVRASLIAAADVDDGEVVRQSLRAIDAFLHPLTGGDDETGWAFGGTLYYDNLIRYVLAKVSILEAISKLNLVIDQTTLTQCSDFVPELNALFWPAVHELRVIDEEDS